MHRDIKPANLLLDNGWHGENPGYGLWPGSMGDGAATQDGLTQSGQVMGTVDYMAPEQAFDTKHADARADIYSLGCTLYRLLVGQPRLQRRFDDAEVPGPPRSPIPILGVNARCLTAICKPIFRRMVAKKPEDRYQTMDEVAATLENCLFAGASQGSFDATIDWKHPPKDLRSQLTTKWYRRRWLLSSVAAVALIILAAGVIVSNLPARRAAEASPSQCFPLIHRGRWAGGQGRAGQPQGQRPTCFRWDADNIDPPWPLRRVIARC